MAHPKRGKRLGNNQNQRAIFDVLYGFIPITEWEEQIINSPFFQRLRWIKQLSFSNYIFPGAEHNRFSHAIGVMHSMHQMLSGLGIAVSDGELFSSKSRSKDALLHKSLRIAALLHDIGTFPFSHAIEYAYIKHGNDSRSHGRGGIQKDLPNSHEHLGSFIIKNTDYEGGITRILNDAGLDVHLISKIIKGDSPHLIANQLMHSDLDADRMDYLMRDAHYTGLKYGEFDRDYIIANLSLYDAGKNQLAFGVRESAMHAVEDFLIARFSWYSQVVKNTESAKFDVLATAVAKSFLEKDQIHQFHDLLNMIKERDERFFWWNDIYFMTRCQQVRYEKTFKESRINEWIKMLLFRKPPKTINHPLFKHQLLRWDTPGHDRTKMISKLRNAVSAMENDLKKRSKGDAWILTDIPDKDIVFTTGLRRLIKSRKSENLHEERDPIKVISRNGTTSLLIEKENSLMLHLSSFINFVPSLYGNESAAKLLSSV